MNLSKARYRIKYIATLGYFAQVCVQEEVKLFPRGWLNGRFSPVTHAEEWKTIGTFPAPDLLGEDYIANPLREVDARSRLDKFRELKLKEEQQPTYIEVR